MLCWVVRAACLRAAASEKLRSAELLRLGFVMALAMTLHNMPEGFAVRPKHLPSPIPASDSQLSPESGNCEAVHGRHGEAGGVTRCVLWRQVAFSAFTDFGAIMALAIAVHNIPEVGFAKLLCF